MEPDLAYEEGERLARKAIDLDDAFAGGYEALSFNLSFKGEFDLAIAALEKAIALAPNSDYSARSQARLRIITGRPEDARAHIKRAMRLNPYYPLGYMSTPCLSGCNPHPLYVGCAVIRQARVSEWKLMF